VPFQLFPTADGYLVIACAKEKFWQRLVAVLRRPDLADDERFTTFAGRREHRAQVQRELTAEFLRRPTDEWVTALREVGIPAQPVNSVTQALDDPQVHARRGIVETEHETLGTVRHVASPLRVAGGARPISRGPFRGEHTRELLREICGYDDAEIARLTEVGAIDRSPVNVSAATTSNGRSADEQTEAGR
jgi:crotonobetainyl-CoA:carnitine CoA-transferase CaiB-like acyl-CoA transferase